MTASGDLPCWRCDSFHAIHCDGCTATEPPCFDHACTLPVHCHRCDQEIPAGPNPYTANTGIEFCSLDCWLEWVMDSEGAS